MTTTLEIQLDFERQTFASYLAKTTFLYWETLRRVVKSTLFI